MKFLYVRLFYTATEWEFWKKQHSVVQRKQVFGKLLVRSELIINRSDHSLQRVIYRIFRMFSEFFIVPDLSIFLDTEPTIATSWPEYSKWPAEENIPRIDKVSCFHSVLIIGVI